MEFSKTFKDALGREWTVELSTATLRRLAQPPLSFRLEEAMPSKTDAKNPAASVEKYQAFLDDDLRFGDVLFAILRPDTDRLGITQEQFEEGLKGGANQQAICAFHAAFTDFSHAPRKTVLRGLRLQMQKEQTFHAIASEKIEGMAADMTDARMETMIDDEIRRARQEQTGGPEIGAAAAPSSKPATGTAAI